MQSLIDLENRAISQYDCINIHGTHCICRSCLGQALTSSNVGGAGGGKAMQRFFFGEHTEKDKGTYVHDSSKNKTKII